MSAQLNFPVDTEILTDDELVGISGMKQRSKQLEWLRNHGWRFMLNGAGEPIVGRWYARLKLAGLDVSNGGADLSYPDFSKVA